MNLNKLSQKNLVITLAVLAICAVVLASYTASPQKSAAYYTGEIIEISGNRALILVDEGMAIRSSGDKVYANLDANPSESFAVGDRVEVGYDGVVMESYPLQAGTDYIKLINN